MDLDKEKPRMERRIPKYYFMFLLMLIFIGIFLWMSGDT